MDDTGQKLTREVRITQLSLESIVVSQVTSTPLTVQQVEQLVADGTIKLDDPQNFNVSQFNIVLTIGREPVPISVPIAVPVAQDIPGFEVIKLPVGGDRPGSTEPPKTIDLIIFDLPVPPGPPGSPRVIGANDDRPKPERIR